MAKSVAYREGLLESLKNKEGKRLMRFHGRLGMVFTRFSLITVLGLFSCSNGGNVGAIATNTGTDAAVCADGCCALTAANRAACVGQFAFSYFNFTTAPGAITETDFVQRFAAAMHNPGAFDAAATDIRAMNPKGYYYKHFNLTADGTTPEGYPDYNYLLKHPEWLVKDVNGHLVVTSPIYNLHLVDFANDAYLDWALNTWMPSGLLDGIDKQPGREIFLMEDMGNFLDPLTPNCASIDTVCNRYATTQGVQNAWIHYLDRLKATYPNSSIIINSEPEISAGDTASQLAVFKNVLSHADGYYCESLTDRHNPVWKGASNDSRRIALKTQLQLANWLAEQDKVFFPNEGVADGTSPTQADTDYAWAFFNLVKKGDKQFFSKRTNVPGQPGTVEPYVYPEMELATGLPIGLFYEIQTNVYRRDFSRAVALVNLSDAQVSVNLPAGKTYVNSLGQTIGPSITLTSFDGLTVYGK